MEKYAECPLCCETFSKNVIEAHASTCGLLQQSSQQPVKRSFASIFTTSPNSENEKKRAKVSKPAKTPPSSSLANNKLSHLASSASPRSRREVDDADPMPASNKPVQNEGGTGESAAGETRDSGSNVSGRSPGVPLAEALRPKVQNLILACIGIYFFKYIFFYLYFIAVSKNKHISQFKR